MLGYFEFNKRARRERTGGAEGGDPPPPSDQDHELRNIDQGRANIFEKKYFYFNIFQRNERRILFATTYLLDMIIVVIFSFKWEDGKFDLPRKDWKYLRSGVLSLESKLHSG